jgi:hypothetical protein
MTIFVQIASYRDPQLVPTIEDLLKKAKYPNQLRVGICRQYHPKDGFDHLEKFKKDKRFRIIEYLFTEAKGTCWARYITQQLYMGEDYTLQVDSHMRFAWNWDETLIQMIKRLRGCGYGKPLLTGYMAAFNPSKPFQVKTDEPPLQMVFDEFSEQGAVVFQSQILKGWKFLKYPAPARFYSAGFCFTIGQFCREVQHDPEYYFLGEEISISVRAFTHGYDLFHPNRTVVWHEYIRKGKRRQWDDDKNWCNRDKISHIRNRRLLGMENGGKTIDFGKFGLGTVRNLRDYEKYAGILFSRRAVQVYTLEGRFPPNPNHYATHEQWLHSFVVCRKHCIRIRKNEFRDKDYDFWVIAYHDQNDVTLCRKDADRKEISRILDMPGEYCEIHREFYGVKPKSWVVWPYSSKSGWCKRLTGPVY